MSRKQALLERVNQCFEVAFVTSTALVAVVLYASLVLWRPSVGISLSGIAIIYAVLCLAQ